MNYLLKTRFRFLFLALLICVSIALMAFGSSTTFLGESAIEVTLKMENLKPEESTVLVAIFQNSESFLGKQRFKSLKIENPGKTTVSQKISLPKGTYGIAVFQDLNDNEKLDKNFIGIPNEPYCFSNDQAGRFGPPSWDEAKVDVNKDSVLSFNF